MPRRRVESEGVSEASRLCHVLFGPKFAAARTERRRLLPGHEPIETLVGVHFVLRFPHEVPFELEGSREIHRIRRRQRVVETAVIRVRDEALDGLDLVALWRPLVIEIARRDVIGLDPYRLESWPSGVIS